MKSELDILKIVIERLDKADIPYMLTGSMAANFYTVPRMTRDIARWSLREGIYMWFRRKTS